MQNVIKQIFQNKEEKKTNLNPNTNNHCCQYNINVCLYFVFCFLAPHT